MKKILLALILFISVTASSSVLDEFVGCYKTVSWNGVMVDQNNMMNDSRIEKGPSQFVLNMDYSTIDAYEMILFQKDEVDTVYYGYAFPFVESSRYSRNKDVVTFDFTGKFRYRPQPEYIGTLSHRVRVKKLSNGNVWIKNHIFVKEIDHFNTDESYELRPVACSN